MKSIFFSIVFIFTVFAFGIVNSQPESEKWEFLKHYGNISLYRAVQSEEERLPFMATADLDIPFQEIVKALVDTEKKQVWAPKLKYTVMHNEESANQYEYSEYYTTPWPFDDREFLLLGTVRYEKEQVVFSAVNSPNRSLADSKHTLANVEMLEFVIIPLTESKSRVRFTFSGDMGGWIPDFVKTIIQKKWPVRFIQALEAYIQEAPEMNTARYQSLKKSPIPLSQQVPEKRTGES